LLHIFQKQRLTFCIYCYVLGAAQKHPLFPKFSDKDAPTTAANNPYSKMDDEIKGWLRHSGDRHRKFLKIEAKRLEKQKELSAEELE